MNFTALEQILQEAMGLDATTIGSASIERAIRERMRATDLKSCEGYIQFVTESSAELQELIETVVVPETWFYRDAGAFTALDQMVRGTNPPRPLRLLCVPCSSGEEPYSAAISLLQAGLVNFEIDAIDISHRALALARHAVYGRNSFRGTKMEFLQQYFEKTAHGHALVEQIKTRVNFEQGNLLDDNFGEKRAKYDFIFCRNLLIYFDIPTRERAFRTLAGLLANDGVLFVGPSESGVATNHGFVSTKVPLSFAFRKASSMPVKAAEKPAVKIHLPPPDTSFLRPPVPPAKPQPAPVAPKPEKIISLEQAREFADAGKFAEATQICLDHLEENGPSSEVYYLLGLVHDASNHRDKARDFYRKAIYLQPDHYEALVQLSALTQSMGDSTGALVLQARAARVMQEVKS